MLCSFLLQPHGWTVILSEVRQRNIIDTVCMWNPEKGTNELIYKNRNRVTDVETRLWLPRGERRGDKLGDWD